MKHWQESRQVFDWLATLEAEQRAAALATIVRVRGSAYRHEGAKLAVAGDGATVGNVSGGCLEGDVREVALQVIASGVPQLRTYCSGSDEVRAWDLGMGCEGEVTILIEPAAVPSLLAATLFRTATPFAICRIVADPPQAGDSRQMVVTAGGRDGRLDGRAFDLAVAARAQEMLAQRASPALLALDEHFVFIDVHIPPPQLVIIGAGNDARPLARFAIDAGFRVTLVDRRPALLTADRFPAGATLIDATAADLGHHLSLEPGDYSVVMTHAFADDAEYLRALVALPPGYIGVLGPRQRTERLVALATATTAFDATRIYAPVGLDIGTDGAEQVALAIVAEMLAIRAGRRPRSLREREAPIHVAAG